MNMKIQQLLTLNKILIILRSRGYAQFFRDLSSCLRKEREKRLIMLIGPQEFPVPKC